MTNYARINEHLTQAIRPSRRPVAIAFRDSGPAGVPAFTGSLPSGCMAIPAAMGDSAISSMGCIGNRIYTELADGEMYMTVSGSRIAEVAAQLETITSANATLTTYHQERRAALTT